MKNATKNNATKNDGWTKISYEKNGEAGRITLKADGLRDARLKATRLLGAGIEITRAQKA